MRDELGESFEHFVQAATHAAGGMGAAVGPRVTAARDYVSPGIDRIRSTATDSWGATMAAFTPLVLAAREGSRQAREAQLKALKKQQNSSRNRWSVLVALAAAGAAMGAAAAYIARRKRLEWAEYDPAHALDEVRDETQSTVDKPASGTSEQARTMADKTSATASKAGNKAKDSADELVRKAGSPGRNSRS
jgi:hypothetical protein